MITLNLVSKLNRKLRIFKHYHIALTSLILSLGTILISQVDWNFHGELKDNRITGPLLGLTLTFFNLIYFIVIGVSFLIYKKSNT